MTAADASSFAAARARVTALAAEIGARDGTPPRLVETAISWVLLGRTLAYKLKKPLRLPFLDFSTLAERRRLCDEELRLNRRFAPDLYLDVVAIREGPAGPSLAGAGRLLDVAVRMRRFPDGALWSERIASGALAAADVDVFAIRLAAVQRAAAVARPDADFGSAAAYARVARRSIAGVDAWQRRRADAIAPEWPMVRDWLERECERLAPHWTSRLREGAIREGHGDLHLANVLQLGDEPVAFDSIEFDPALRWIDPLDDAAFLVMDLLVHDRRDLAFRFLDAYLAASGEHDGLPGLRYFLVSRALVRAQVGALCEARAIATQSGRRASDYLRAAAAIASADDARLAITHGLPGSGKTFVSARMLEDVGAIRIRSDVERKRLFGLSPLQSSRDRGDELYGASATRRTYARLREIARTALAAGWPTIVDAAFLRRAERADFAALAAGLGAPFAIVDCRAGMALLRSRVAARQAAGSDASEADVGVLERLADADEPLDENERAHLVAVVADAADAASAPATRWLAIR
jgi:aminoglycoside phosphotransferase family enzyme/predicted kinase